MSRRTLLSILLAPTMIVLFTGATVVAGTAQADASICADGALAFAYAEPDAVRLNGTIQPCPGTDPAAVADANWAVARYHAEGAFVYSDRIRPFDSATEPTVFEARVIVDGEEAALWGQIQAACLVTAAEVRLACVEITAESNGDLRVGPIPANDPRVTGWVSVVADAPAHPDPECGACV
jgi:hypothetical protein